MAGKQKDIGRINIDKVLLIMFANSLIYEVKAEIK